MPLTKVNPFQMSCVTLLTNTISQWFASLYFLAKQALKMAVDEERNIKGDIYSQGVF
jgi:hypothetical protein